MGISISGVKARSFIDAPVVVCLSLSDAYPSSATMRKVHLRVLCTYQSVVRDRTFTQEAYDDSLYMDISSALRASMFQRNVVSIYKNATKLLGTTGSDGNKVTSVLIKNTSDCATFRLQAYVSFVLDGYYFEGIYSNGALTSGGYVEQAGFTAYFGGLSAIERLYGGWVDLNSSSAVCLSTKPLEGEIIGDNHVFFVSTIASDGCPTYYPFLRYKYSTPQTYFTIDGLLTRKAYIDTSNKYIDFLFVNRLGGIEDACIKTHEALYYNIQKTTFKSISAPYSDSQTVLLRSSRTGSNPRWDMSSGFVTREWAEWWAGEFLAACSHWMKLPSERLSVRTGEVQEVWVPVTIKPKSEDVTVYNRADSSPMHVDFTVELAYEGRV